MVETATANPKVLLELFSMYRDWQEERVEEISKKQVCLIKNSSILDSRFYNTPTLSTRNKGNFFHAHIIFFPM